jgi:hypothetical protein
MHFVWSLPRNAFLEQFRLKRDTPICDTESWSAEYSLNRHFNVNSILDRLKRYVSRKTPFLLPELPGAQGYEYALSTWIRHIVRNSEVLMILEVFSADILPEMIGQYVEQSRQGLRVRGLDDYKRLMRDGSSWRDCLFEDAPEDQGHGFLCRDSHFCAAGLSKTFREQRAFDRACDLPGLKMIVLCARNTTAGTLTQVPGAQEDRGNVNRKISRHTPREHMSVQVVSKFDAVSIGMPACC